MKRRVQEGSNLLPDVDSYPPPHTHTHASGTLCLPLNCIRTVARTNSNTASTHAQYSRLFSLKSG